MNIYIGFDFSLKKTAITIIKGGVVKHISVPFHLDDKSETKLKEVEVEVYNLSSFKASTDTYHETMRNNTLDAQKLCDGIVNALKSYVTDEDVVYIAQEGFSYGSTGSSILELAGYKYILLHYLSLNFNINNIYTYAPITVKKTANCAKKSMGKEEMINAYINEDVNNTFHETLKNNNSYLRKKKHYIECIDDIVDSYWVVKTMINDLKNNKN